MQSRQLLPSVGETGVFDVFVNRQTEIKSSSNSYVGSLSSFETEFGSFASFVFKSFKKCFEAFSIMKIFCRLQSL